MSLARGSMRDMSDPLGRLQQVDVRTVWKHEAHDFTRWMLSAADVLGEALGMELELTQAEHRVGGFSLDLIGNDLSTGNVVIVENQLEQTDHGHLGQILTYAGGTDPSTIVWCAPSFRDEHRAALDWLNENTGEGIRFFGVEISAVRIDDSRPAPLFKVVAKPNDWTKQVQVDKTASLSGKAAAYREFWAEFLDRVKRDHPSWTNSTIPPASSWTTLPYGQSGLHYGVSFTLQGPRVELYFGSPDDALNLERFEQFVAYGQPFRDEFGDAVEFEPLPDRKACRISVTHPTKVDILDPDTDGVLDWMVVTLERFRGATLAARAAIEGAP